MQAAVAGIAVRLAAHTQHWIANGKLPGFDEEANSLADFSTKPWRIPKICTRRTCVIACDQSYQGAEEKAYKASEGRDTCADRCSLIVVAFKLFQSLKTKATQAGSSTQGAA